MPNISINFNIEGELFTELATAIAKILDKNEGESDINLVKRLVENQFVRIVNKARADSATWTEATSVFTS